MRVIIRISVRITNAELPQKFRNKSTLTDHHLSALGFEAQCPPSLNRSGSPAIQIHRDPSYWRTRRSQLPACFVRRTGIHARQLSHAKQLSGQGMKFPQETKPPFPGPAQRGFPFQQFSGEPLKRTARERITPKINTQTKLKRNPAAIIAAQ